MKGKTTVCQLQCFFGLRNKTWPFKYLDKFCNMGQGWECRLWEFFLVCETVENMICLQRTKAKSTSCFKEQYKKNQNIIRKKNTDKSQSQCGILRVKKMPISLHDQSTAVLRLVNIVCDVYPEGNKKSTAQPTFVKLWHTTYKFNGDYPMKFYAVLWNSFYKMPWIGNT